MENKSLTHWSKFLSFVLRHQPQAIGVVLDRHGWAEIDELVARCRAHGMPLSREILAELIAARPKRRFAVSADGLRLRASQGHSVQVDLDYEPQAPLPVLFHGTVAPRLAAIRSEGLRKMDRHHVHLSADAATAHAVGMRRGTPVVLRIAAARMHADGHVFFLSANGVWLTAQVPPGYIEFPDPTITHEGNRRAPS